MNTTAIIVAAGIGSRMGGAVNKHLLLLAGKPVLAHTLAVFEDCPVVDGIILVGGQDRIAAYRQMVRDFTFAKVRAVVAGGNTRQESCVKGLAQATAADIVIMHDGARPLVTAHMIAATVAAAKVHGAAIVAVPVKDTIKQGDAEGFVTATLERALLWQVQTPQTFRADILRHAQSEARGVFTGTDDAALVERLGLPVKIVPGDYSNLKITTPDDLVIAEYLFGLQRLQGQEL